MKILRFEFKTNNCEFRAIKNGTSYNINDKRTKATKQYKEFGEITLRGLIYTGVSIDSYWTEKVTKSGCVLAVQVKG